MFDTIEEIKKNPYLNNFEKIAANFGLYGRYVNYSGNADFEKNGIYFVYGLNKDEVYGDVDIEEIVDRNNKEREFIHYGCFVAKITNCDPFALHQLVVEDCRHAEFAKNTYTEYHQKLPDKMSIEGLQYLKMLYVNARNPELPRATRDAYEETLKFQFSLEDAYHNPQNPNYHKDSYVDMGHYDTSKGKLANKMRQAFGKDNNKVSLEHLISKCNTIGKYVINAKLADTVQKEMRKHPEILYWMSEPKGKIWDVPEGQGFGPEKKDNDIRTVVLAFNNAYDDEVTNIINKICYPEGFGLNYDEFAKGNEPLVVIGVHDGDYKNFCNLCETNDVRFCIDDKVKKQKGDILNIVVRKADMPTVDAICRRISSESEQFHISIPRVPKIGERDMPRIDAEKIQKSINRQGLSLEEKLKEDVQEQFGNGDWVILSNTLSDDAR